jgi:hypothetical protein
MLLDAKIEKAKLIVSASKSLRAFQIGDQNIARYFGATSVAGRAGLLASAIRGHDTLDSKAFHAMAATEGFSTIELRTTIVPWLEEQLLADVDRAAGQIVAIRSIILSYDHLLNAVTQLWENLGPDDVDRACIDACIACIAIPRGRSELLQQLTVTYGEETAKIAVGLLVAYKLLEQVQTGLIEPILYSPMVWKRTMAAAAPALSTLDVTSREVLLHMVNQVRQHQGLPEPVVFNATNLLDLGIRIGLLERTKIRTLSNADRCFLVTPHFYADVASEHGEDYCDRVKIFLDSIRNGQHYGNPVTGRITDPDRLLEVLLDRGWVGPVQAIGTGYILPEKAGIVRVEPDETNSSKYRLHLVQTDTVKTVRQIIRTGSSDPGLVEMNAARLQGGTDFSASETLRARLGELPAQVAEAEAELIRVLREGGCRTK